MKTILFPTDFSQNANRALEYAVEMAAISEAKLYLLNVYTPIVSKSNVLSALITDEIQDRKRDAYAKLGIIKKTLYEEFPLVQTEILVTEGETVPTILSVAQIVNAELIIMGTRGASNFTKMLLGSNTAFIIEESECPVLAIPAGFKFRVPKKILFATDYSEKNVEQIKSLATIAEKFQAQIIIGHVDTSVDEETDKDTQMNIFITKVKQVVSYSKIDSRVVSDHNVSMGIDTLIEENQIDIFAITTRKRTWIEKIFNPSLTKKISDYTDIPLLAFHNAEEIHGI